MATSNRKRQRSPSPFPTSRKRPVLSTPACIGSTLQPASERSSDLSSDSASTANDDTSNDWSSSHADESNSDEEVNSGDGLNNDGDELSEEKPDNDQSSDDDESSGEGDGSSSVTMDSGSDGAESSDDGEDSSDDGEDSSDDGEDASDDGEESSDDGEESSDDGEDSTCESNHEDESSSGAVPKLVPVRRRATAPGKALTTLGPDDLYEEFTVAATSGHLRVAQIDSNSWAVQLLASEDGPIVRRVVRQWTLVRKITKSLAETEFSCSSCSKHDDCVHSRYIQSTEDESRTILSDKDYPDACAFYRRLATHNQPAVVLFACVSMLSHADALVSYVGNHEDGVWDCSTHAKVSSCEHILQARRSNLLAELLAGAPRLRPSELSAAEDMDDAPVNDADLLADRRKMEERCVEEILTERSISYKRVGPPPWLRLRGEAEEWFESVWPPPMVLKLEDDAQCVCGTHGNASDPIEILDECYVYSSFGVRKVQLEVKRCPSCALSRNRYVGPDLRELGLFNFSNQSIFTHELLNSFTSQMSSHSTPFHAFCADKRRHYRCLKSPFVFASADTFRAAWFSWSGVVDIVRGASRTEGALQQSCPACGPTPDIVIVDAKTAGIQKRRVLSTMMPPTAVLPGAPSRKDVRPPVNPTSCATGQTRIDAQRLCRWRMKLSGTKNGKSAVAGVQGDEDEDEDAADADVDSEGAKRQARARTKKRDQTDGANYAEVLRVSKKLRAQDKFLAALFLEHVGAPWKKIEEPSRRPYLELLQQILAYESVLQFAPATSWAALRLLAVGHPDAAEVLLRHIPALGVVATLEKRLNGYSTNLMGIAEFVETRADSVLRMLELANPDGTSNDGFPSATVMKDNWRETGQCYGASVKRMRPSYPRLPHDQWVDRSIVSESSTGGGIGCNKFYENYGKKGLTGGIMAIWCPHMICVGWHCIPRGEGRNDAFSALFTRWETAPDYVIYDYACALAPYCMVREPAFFKNTIFLIDDFHAKGHTRCTPACFTKTYRKHTPQLTKVNTSAAECGNSALNRIVLPLSYMSQRHAIIFTTVFLEVWNRSRRIQAEESAAAKNVSLLAAFDASEFIIDNLDQDRYA